MRKIYHISIALLAFISVIFAILDLCRTIDIAQQPFYLIDTIILLIFTIDYIVRFFHADNKKVFFKENIFDLIAIIPFSSVFTAFKAVRVFRGLKMTRLAKLSQVVRAAAYFQILKRKLSGILYTNGFLYVLYTNIILIIISSLIMMFAENRTFADALWWSIVTCTTVGYGDISPSTAIGRIIAVILMLFGIGMIGMLTGAITTYFTSRHSPNGKADEELQSIINSLDDEQKQKLIEIAKILAK